MSKLKIEKLITSSSRREFAKSLAVIVAAPVVSRAGEANATPASPLQQTPPADQPSPVAESLTEVVRLRHGKHLSEEQLNLVKRSIDRSQRNADRMKQFKLVNSDEPAFAFTADI
ncbi:MAG TPA: hypothetical protein VF131_24735 [Blastocatellia bacterium]|nr:hypothetical protein [Blastocatellia bacterium]